MVVIGAGPAGLAAAIALRRKGMSVIVADAQTGPIDKACGEGLLPDGLAAARRLGIDIPLSSGAPIEGIHFILGNHSVQANFPVGVGMGIRRWRLHTLLTERALADGVCVRWGLPVAAVEADRIVTSHGPVYARWIVVADGARSRRRAQLGLDTPPSRTRYAFRQHFPIAPWNQSVEVHWGNREQVSITPVGATEIGVAVMSLDPNGRIAQILSRFPSIAQRLAGVDASSAEKGAATTTQRLAALTKGNVVLIGDASGTVDVITGEGIGLAIHQAEALAESLTSGNTRDYTSAHRRISRRPRVMAELMLSLSRHPKGTEAAISLLEAFPRLFARLVAYHVQSEGKLH